MTERRDKRYRKLIDKYSINENGVIINDKTRRVLKQKVNKRGYAYVTISINGKLKDISIHRAVAETFIPNPENKPQVNHIDGDKLNNNVNNLEWCSAKDNMKHAVENKLWDYAGTKNCKSKLSKESLEEIKALNSQGFSSRKIADKFNVSKTAILYLLNGKTYKEEFKVLS